MASYGISGFSVKREKYYHKYSFAVKMSNCFVGFFVFLYVPVI